MVVHLCLKYNSGKKTISQRDLYKITLFSFLVVYLSVLIVRVSLVHVFLKGLPQAEDRRTQTIIGQDHCVVYSFLYFLHGGHPTSVSSKLLLLPSFLQIPTFLSVWAKMKREGMRLPNRVISPLFHWSCCFSVSWRMQNSQNYAEKLENLL